MVGGGGGVVGKAWGSGVGGGWGQVLQPSPQMVEQFPGGCDVNTKELEPRSARNSTCGRLGG